MERVDNSEIIQSPLFDTLQDYLKKRDSEESRIFLIVPYIKTAVLEKILHNLRGKITIITTWKPEDLISGSSELSLYPFCKKRGITLYVNNRIHLKVYTVDFDDILLATANISQRGLGTIPKYNFECATIIYNLSNEDRRYFAEIQKNSIHVDDKLFSQLLEWYERQEKKIMKDIPIEDIVSIKEKESFLISALPMTRNIEIFQESYMRLNQGLKILDRETRDCVFHDLANYNVPLHLTRDEFIKTLTKSFFVHPFIQKIDEFISPEAYFGRIKEWIQNNCTDVPVPSRRELTGNVQVLLEWFEILGNGKYAIDIPGTHSQRIKKMT